MVNLRELLKSRAKEFPKKRFLYEEGKELSFEQFADSALRIASWLKDRGIKKGERVALLIPNGENFVKLFFGIVSSGAVVVPINFHWRAKEVEYILQDSEAKLLFYDPLHNDTVSRLQKENLALEHYVKVEAFGGILSQILQMPLKDDLPPLEPQNLASLLYTAGTTGRPKGVMLSHTNYLSNVKDVVEALEVTEDDRFLCLLPLFHVLGQVVMMLVPFYAGAEVVLLPGFSPRELLPKLTEYRISIFAGVPTVYTILNNLPASKTYDLSSIRFCLCGGAPLSVSVLKEFEERYHSMILEGYGLSEGTCASSVNLPYSRRIGSVGLALASQEIEIVNEEGKKLEPFEVGEIVIKGENVMLGYFRDIQATKEVLRDGWLYTGDLGYRDELGFLYIKGRKKDMIIRGGENIYPREIEDVISKHPAVQEVAVIGVPDKIWGEEVAAFVVLKDKVNIVSSELFRFCEENLASYKCPKIIQFIDSLPRASTGAVLKQKLLEYY